MKWIKATEPIVEVELSELSKDIIEEMKSKWGRYFLNEGKIIISKKTRSCKLFELLTELGDHKRYKVCSHGLSEEFRDRHNKDNNDIIKFVNREWLFDLCWYREVEHRYLFKSLDLTVEVEWTNNRNKDKYGGIKYDFQKLLVVNMGLCLMVVEVTENGREDLAKYFEEVYDIYEGNKTEILFIAFSRKEKTFYYSYLPKKQKDM